LKKQKISGLLVMAGLLINLCACSGGGGGGTGATPSPGDTSSEQVATDMSSVAVSMTYDERNAAISMVDVFAAANRTTDLDADNAALVTYILTQPEFADAGVSPDRTVWARFKDGRPVVWLTAARIGLSAPGFPANSMSPGAERALSLRAAEMPQGDKAVLIDMDGLGRGAPAVVAGWLSTAGYSPVQSGGSLNDLMTKIKDVAVLHFSTHGVFATGQDGKRTYTLASAERFGDQSIATSSEDLLREEMYNEGVLSRAEYERPDGTIVHYWAVTEKFVTTYWTFTPDSLIVIDACSLFDKSTPARAAVGASFRAALTAVSGGKTTIVGWDNVVAADFAANTVKLFFDRVLGANTVNPENPPQRPFSYADVYDWMVSKGKVTDVTTPNAKLTLEPNGTPSGQLVPSIQRMTVYTPAAGAQYAGEWILELSGDFGPDQDTVSVNGSQLNIHTWSEHSIIAQLPASMDSPGSSGDTIVEVRGHKSNAVPLTQWTGTVSQTQADTDIGSGAQVSISCPVRATSDVHYYRTAPGGTLSILSDMVFEVPGACTYTLSGSWSSGDIQYDLVGSGNASPLSLVSIYGSLLYTGTASALPVDFSGGVVPLVEAPGLLTGTDNSVVPPTITTETDYAGWAYAQTGINSTGVTLGTDYHFTTSRSCAGLGGTTPRQCTETWNLTPVPLTAPTATTQS
jgi:hypothetical protein